MRTAITILILLATMFNCDGPDEARSSTPLDLTCAAVYYDGGGSISRCENSEVICYVRDGDGLACMKKGTP